MIDGLFYSKLLPHLKRLINLAYLENGTYNQIVAHTEKELKLIGLKTDEELPNPTMSTTTVTLNKRTQPQTAKQEQINCRYCTKPGLVIKECQKGINIEQERKSANQTT